MKLHEIKLEKNTYRFFYDKHLRLWVVYEVDKDGNQIGYAGYWTSKEDIINYAKKYGEL